MLKSDSLQYNTLVRWDESTRHLMFQVLFFFHNFLQNSLQKLFQINFSLFFYKNENKDFECPNSITNYEKNNAWKIRRLVYESFVPLTQRPSVLY
jgi:hypothetical protein